MVAGYFYGVTHNKPRWEATREGSPLDVMSKFYCRFDVRGLARTQVPTTRNYTLELPTFGVIAGVNPIEVQ